MFGIRFFTPQALSSQGSPIAGAVLRIGDTQLRFAVDLSHWTRAQYERQWGEGIQRLARGAASSALVYAYRGRGDATHLMWVLWRDDRFVYIQDQALVSSELDAPFDPMASYAHVGAHVGPQHGLPIGEWRLALEDLLAASIGRRPPRLA
jgi:hypothetical protein